MKSLFCNKDCELEYAIPDLFAKMVLGEELKSEIRVRYDDMRNNFEMDYAQWQDNFKTVGKPYQDPKNASKNDDDTKICVDILHPDFKNDIEIIENHGSIGVDLSTWFNIGANKRVMIVAQDPLRSAYHKNNKKISLSSPFALHDMPHRQKGGNQCYSIIESLVRRGLGVYLTDVRKYYIKDAKTSSKFSNLKKDIYDDILSKEIEILQPSIIIAFGKSPSSYFVDSVEFFKTTQTKFDIPLLPMVHISGAARGGIRKYLPALQNQKLTNNVVSQAYCEIICMQIVV